MFDYEARYQCLRAGGALAWAGPQSERGLRRLQRQLDRLERDKVLPTPPARFLELGCGNGASSLLMAERGYEAWGIDISPTAVGWARERFAASKLPAVLCQGDVRDMRSMADAFFDIVVDGSCLHCLVGSDRADCLAEVRRVLKPDGILVVSSMCGLPKSDEARSRFDPARTCLLHDGEPYRTLKPLGALEHELGAAGFAVRDSHVALNPWWDHATIVCHAKE
jgi:SAM-dependent methyltransferase